MSVSYVQELWPGRGGTDDIWKHGTSRRVFEVRTTDPLDDETVAVGTILLPRLGDFHPTFPRAFVTGIEGRQQDSDPTLWTVTVTYDTELPGRPGSGVGGISGPGAESQGHDSSGSPTSAPDPLIRPENPVDRRPAWTTETVEVEEPFTHDASGSAILNSAGYPYDPPLTTTRRRLLIGLNKNVTGIGFTTLEAYLDRLNDVTWRGFDAGTVRVWTVRKQSAYENGFDYTQVFIQFMVRAEGWKRKVIDRGYVEMIETLGIFVPVQIRDPKTGVPYPDPQLLDGAGRKLAAGLPAVNYPTDGYTEFGSADFGALETLLGIS